MSKADDEPLFPPIGGPPDEINARFHEAHRGACEAAEQVGPVLVLLGDVLVLVRDGARKEIAVTPRVVHVIKSVAHGPVALYALLSKVGASALGRAERDAMKRVQAALAACLATLPEDVADTEARADLAALVETSVAFLAGASSATAVDSAALEGFAASCGPLLLRATEHATKVQLAALHEAVEQAIRGLPKNELGALQVVVAGDHQARARSLGMQYFEKRLGERPGAEVRLAYAENITEAEEAVALVGARRFARTMATAFFGDAKKLQQDVLGDAAAGLLRHYEVDPLT